MEYKTTIAFSIDWADLNNIPEIVNKISVLAEYIIDNYTTYQFIAFQNEEVCSTSEEIKNKFDDFIGYLKTNFFLNENYLEVSPGPYSSEKIDLEEGEIEFSKTFNINETSIDIYLGILSWYSSELEKLPYGGLGISCEMNDSDGYYYWFDI